MMDFTDKVQVRTLAMPGPVHKNLKSTNTLGRLANNSNHLREISTEEVPMIELQSKCMPHQVEEAILV